MRRTVTSVSALVVAASLALSACSGADEPEAGQPTTNAPAPQAPPRPAFVDGEPATVDGVPTQFDKSKEVVFPESGVVAVALSEERAFTAGGSQVIARSMPDLADAYTINAETGNFVDLLTDDDTGLGYALSQDLQVGSGTSLGKEFYSVQRFDLESGEVTGSASVSMPQDNTGGGAGRTGRIVGVDDDRVVIGIGGDSDQVDRSTAALNMATGKSDWTFKHGDPLAVVDGIVLVNTGTEAEPAPVFGVKATNGKKAWTSLLFTKDASFVGERDGVAMIASTDGYYNFSAITPVQLKNGKSDKRLKAIEIDDATLECGDAGDDVAVCSDTEGGVVGWNLKKLKRLWKLPTKSRLAPTVTAVQDGLIYGHIGDGDAIVMDANTGDDIVTVAGVSPSAVNAYGGMYTFVDAALFSPVNETESTEE